jgi:hypothetical protein
MVDVDRIVTAELRTPRAAAVAGIVFAVVFGLVLVLLRQALPSPAGGTSWILQPSHRRTLKLALQLIPFAGIAFIWFIGVIRSRIGDREDKLFATVFLGSGLLFVAMLFTSTAVLGGVLELFRGNTNVPTANILLAGQIGRFLLTTLGFRMAAVFTLATTNLGFRTGVLPRWLVIGGFAVAAVLFFIPPHIIWVALLFPGWVLVLSLYILFVSFRVDVVAPAAPAPSGSLP